MTTSENKKATQGWGHGAVECRVVRELRPRGLFGPSLGLTPAGLVALRLRENSFLTNFSNLGAIRAGF